jgi:hypothetical protein
MTIWCIVADGAGAPVHDCVCSIWSTRALAESERSRLLAHDISPGGYIDAALSVVAVEMNTPRNIWIGSSEQGPGESPEVVPGSGTETVPKTQKRS